MFDFSFRGKQACKTLHDSCSVAVQSTVLTGMLCVDYQHSPDEDAPVVVNEDLNSLKFYLP